MPATIRQRFQVAQQHRVVMAPRVPIRRPERDQLRRQHVIVTGIEQLTDTTEPLRPGKRGQHGRRA